MTRKSAFLLAALLALGPAGAAIDVPLQLVKHPADGQGWLPGGSTILTPLAKTPDAVLPKLQHPAPIFAEAKLGQATFLVILDSDSPDRPFYNRLYLDANRNKDLTDDPVLTVEPTIAQGRPPMATFPPLDLMLPVDGAERPYRIRMRAYTRLMRPATLIRPSGGAPAAPESDKPEEVVLLYAMPACHMEGSFTLGETTYRIALADMNGNGIFGDLPAAPTGASRVVQRGDMLYLSAKGAFAPQDAIAPGSQVLLGGSLLTFNLKNDGTGLELDAIEGEMALLRFPMPLERLQLMREGSGAAVTVFQPGKEILLPAGKYRLVSYEARRQDDGGNWWSLRASAPREGASWVEVALPAGASLPFGEPFTAGVSATPRFRDGATGQAHLAFSLLGAGGERVSALTASGSAASKYPRSPKSNTRPKEPLFTVTKADGTEVTSGNFEYG